MPNVFDDPRQEGSAHFAHIIAMTPDAVISVDGDQRIILFNPGAEQIFGYRAEEVLGQSVELLIPERFVQSHRQHFRRFAASPDRVVRLGAYRELFGRRRDGAEFPIEASIGKTEDHGTVTFTVILRDITERKRLEGRLGVQYAVVQILAGSDTLEDAVAQILHAVCECLGWKVGEWWGVDPSANVLRRIACWHSPSLSAEEVEYVTESGQYTFAPNVGLPGRIWASGKPYWLSDAASDPAFVRAALAARAGLHAACGFPIEFGDEILGVMIFACSRIAEPDGDLLQMFAAIGAHVGQFIKRKQAEEAVRESERKYRLLVENASEIIYLTEAGDDPLAAKAVLVSGQVENLIGYTPDEFVHDPGLWSRIIHPDDAPLVWETTQRIVATKQAVTREYRIRHKVTGETLWMEDKVVPQIDQAGRLIGFFGMARDMTARKHAEFALRKLSSAVEQTADTVVITDKDGFFEYVNPAFQKFTGYTAEETAGKTPRLLKSGRHGPEFYEELWRTIRGGEVFRGTFVNKKKNGELYYEEKTITPLKDDQGNITHFVSTGKDITLRQQHERELETIVAMTNALRTAPSRAEMIPIIVDQLLNLLDVESAALGLRDAATGGTVIELARGHWASVAGQRLPPGHGLGGQVIVTGQPYLNNDVRNDPHCVQLGLSGDVRAVVCVPLAAQAQVFGVLWAGRQAAFAEAELRLFMTIADIAANAMHRSTLHELERRRLQESEAMAAISRALNETLDVGRILQMIVDAAQRTIPRVERTVIHRFDEPRQVLEAAAVAGLPELGEPDFTMRPGEGVAGLVMAEGQAINVNDTRTDPRYLVRGPATHLRSLLVAPIQRGARRFGTISVQSAAPGAFSDDDERLLDRLGIEAAIAIGNAQLYEEQRTLLREREQAQSQLLHSEKMAAMGRLAASLAHEINNPLQSVQGCLTLAKEELDGGQRREKLDRYLTVAASEIERVSVIVHRMRDFYRPARAELQPVDVHSTLEGVLELTNKQLQHAKVRVARSWAASLPPIRANPDHLKQVFLNLILNAIDAMPQGGTLSILTAADEIKTQDDAPPRPAVRIAFSDVGKGMPPEVLSHVFEPFFTSKEQGSGLGLSVSYGIIQAHNGQITAASGEGGGSIFTILLPLSQ